MISIGSMYNRDIKQYKYCTWIEWSICRTLPPSIFIFRFLFSRRFNVVLTVPFLLLSSLLLINFRKLHLIVTQMHVTDILLCNIGHNHIVSVNNEKVLE